MRTFIKHQAVRVLILILLFSSQKTIGQFLGGNYSGWARGVVNGTLLPIELLSFTGNYSNDKVILEWQTASEINNDYFTIEKSIDSKNWNICGITKAGGNSSVSLFYSFLDQDLLGNSCFYRLKQTDFDGKYSYSSIIRVELQKEILNQEHFTLFPNPVKSGGNIYIQNINAYTPYQEVLIVVYDSYGREMFSKVVVTNNNGKYISTIDPYNNIPPGVYVVRATSKEAYYGQILVIEE